MQIFTHEEFKKPGWIQKLFHKTPQENALIQINNMQAEAEKNIQQISVDNIVDIGNLYEVEPKV